MFEDGREIGIFAVEIDKVGAEVPLLEHVAGPGEVVDPWCSLFRPRFIAIEPLAKRPERQSRSLPDQWLMSGFVNHEAIDSVEQFLISVGFSVAGDHPHGAAAAVIDSAAAIFWP